MSSIPWARLVRLIRSRLEEGSALPSVSEVARADHDPARYAAHSVPFRVLVATMISLRTKDAVTSAASERLLGAAPSPQSLSRMPESRIARLIYPAGFYRTKARSLRKTAGILVAEHGGRVPRTMEELLALPGVGRKTANLVLNLGYGIPGICVDTHVHRISNRTGWVSTRTPEETERALMKVLPRRYWISINEMLVRFGQTVCAPVSPRCSTCPITAWCARTGVTRSR